MLPNSKIDPYKIKVEFTYQLVALQTTHAATCPVLMIWILIIYLCIHRTWRTE